MIARSAAGRDPSAARGVFHQLLFAQALALVSTGVATIALALLAYDIAGADAGAVLGTALGIKMIGYVVLTPIMSALSEHLPRRATLVFLDLVRAAVVFALPFVTRVIEIYVLIFVFQAASATFTAVFQSTVPELLVDRREYARALSLSRLVVEFENLVSPLLAAAFLLAVSFRGLFVATVFGFLLSAAIVLVSALPKSRAPVSQDIWHRASRGIRAFIAIPRLRGLLALNMVSAISTAMVIVNTVVLVQAEFGLTEMATAVALAAYGAGSVVGALLISTLISRSSDRTVMLIGGIAVTVGLAVGIAIASYSVLLPIWFLLGFGASLAQVPSGVLICRSSGEDDRQSLYATQFALSNACLLVTYPLAGWLGSEVGMPLAFVFFCGLACVAVLAAARTWPPSDRAALEA